MLIPAQVSRYLSGEMDEIEKAGFRERMKADANLRAEVDSLEEIWEMTDSGNFRQPDASEVDKAWMNLANRIAGEEKQDIGHFAKIKAFPNWMKWAAIWVSAIILSFSAWYLSRPTHTETFISLANPDINVTTASFLNDGSIVYLSGGSQVSFGNDFAKNNRAVSLAGEAFFDITHDTLQPFTIQTGMVSIEVLGTSFYVDASRDDQFEIFVEKGLVRATVKSSGEPVLLAAGEYMSVDGNRFHKSSLNNRHVEMLYKPLHFSNEPLENILKILSRKYDMVFSASDPVKQRNLTLTIYDTTPETISKAIALSLGVEYEIKKDNTVEFR